MTGAVLDGLADAAGAVDAARDLLGTVPVDGVVGVLRAAEELARKAHALTLAAVAAAESTGVAAGFGSTARLLEHALRLPAAEARARVAQATALGPRRALTGEELSPELPATAAALAAGTIGAPQVAVIVDAVARVPASAGPEVRARVDAQLADLAQQHTVPALRRLAQRILDHLDPDGPGPDDDAPAAPAAGSVRWWRRRDGRFGVEGWLEPVPGAALDALLAALAEPGPTVDGVPDPRTADQRTADALVEAGDLAAPHRPARPRVPSRRTSRSPSTSPPCAQRSGPPSRVVRCRTRSIWPASPRPATAGAPSAAATRSAPGARSAGRPAASPAPRARSAPTPSTMTVGVPAPARSSTTAPTSAPPRPASPRATPGSSPSSSAPTASRSTSAGPPAP